MNRTLPPGDCGQPKHRTFGFLFDDFSSFAGNKARPCVNQFLR